MQVLCEFLVSNDFDLLRQLRSASNSEAWLGAAVLTAEEHAFMNEVVIATARRPEEAERSRSPCAPERVPTSREVARSSVETLLQDRPGNTLSAGYGPRNALRSIGLRQLSEAAREDWLGEARIDAILGSCLKTLPSVRSGVRAYMAFVSEWAAQ